MCQRDLDDIDPKERGVGILVGFTARALRHFLHLTDESRPRDIDVHIVLVLRVDEERMRVRAPATLHCRDLLRIREVADVEDADAAEPVRAGRRKRAPYAPWRAIRVRRRWWRR